MSDFEQSEFERRTERAQAAMRARELDALLFCSEAEVRYFSGFRTQFWLSPTRPWFLLVPAAAEPIAVIPEIGAELMAKTWIKDIRAWPAPRPSDDGVGLLTQALRGYSRVGLPMSEETSLRMPLLTFEEVRRGSGVDFVDCSDLIKALRMLKSAAEIALLESICAIASAAFARAPRLFRQGQQLKDVFREFKIALLEEGADDVPYLVGGAGQGGYGDVISPPTAEPLREGDILMLDTGATVGGYFCDFDRNFAIGRADEAAKSAYRQLWRATEAGLESSRPGVAVSVLFRAMHEALGGGTTNVGRYGHGLGMHLTEWPSVAAHDQTILEPGMVISLEPSLSIAPGRMMVHEENILVTDGAPLLLTERAAPELPIL